MIPARLEAQGFSWQLFVASRKNCRVNDGVSRDQSGTCSKRVRSLAIKLDRDGHNLGSEILQWYPWRKGVGSRTWGHESRTLSKLRNQSKQRSKNWKILKIRKTNDLGKMHRLISSRLVGRSSSWNLSQRASCSTRYYATCHVIQKYHLRYLYVFCFTIFLIWQVT